MTPRSLHHTLSMSLRHYPYAYPLMHIPSAYSPHSTMDDAPPPYQQQPPPPTYSASGTDANEFNHDPKLVATCKKLGISTLFGSQLHHVTDFVKIRIAIDVSGSMMATSIVRSRFNESSSKSLFWPHRQTRWHELRAQLKLLFDICTEEELIPNGIDVFF